MSLTHRFEQFSPDALRQLRTELRQSGLDSFQCGTLLAAFLTNKGYGVSTVAARDAVVRMETGAFTLPALQAELEKLAQVM